MNPYLLNPNGGWCWFQDERALVIGNTLVFASVAGSDGEGASVGDVQVTSVPLDDFSNPVVTTLATGFQPDDHDVPALLRLADGRLAAFYQTHGAHHTQADSTLMRWRLSRAPGDFTEWETERSLPAPGRISYANPFLLPAEDGRIYNFFRATRKTKHPRDNNPFYAISDDNAASFRVGGRLISWSPNVDDPKFTGRDGGRPYVKYASNGRDTIHFVTSEDHPRAYDNSLYHGFIRGGVIHASDGTPLQPLSTNLDQALDLRRLTRVFEGGPDDVAWPSDFHLNEQGHPVVLFSIQKDGAAVRTELEPDTGGMDHRCAMAWWDGREWRHREIGYAGTCLYRRENDYTGLGALVPPRCSEVVLSTNAHPQTNEPLISQIDGRRHHELFLGTDPGNGREWEWRALTVHSDRDQLRPIVPAPEAGRTALLWLRGEYRTWQDYTLQVMGAPFPPA